MVLEILPASDGTVWYGTGRGVRRRHTTGIIQSFESVLGTALQEVTGLAEDADGNIWISSGSTFEGAYRWDGVNWTHFGADEGLAAQRVHKIRRDRRGRLWFLGMARVRWRAPDEEEPGPFVYSDGRFQRWGPADGLPSQRVYAFAETQDALWFGTAGGLSRWKNDAWTHWTREQGLRADKVFTVAVGPEGRIWFAHQELGVGFLEEEQPHYRTTADGLIHDEAWDLGADGHGRMWISTQGGLCSHERDLWSCFDMTSGLNNERLWPLHITEDKIYVGTLGNGVNVLRLDETVRPAPLVVLDEPVFEGDAVLLRWHAYSYAGALAPAVVETRYRMPHDAWSEWSTTRQVRLELPAGRHDFEVQAKGMFGHISPSPSTATFTVAPPLFRQPVFLLPVGLLAATVLGLLGMLAARKRRHDRAIRESEKNFRTIFENVQDAFFQTDAEGRIVEISPSVRLHLGKTRDQVIGTHLHDHAAARVDGQVLVELLRTHGEVRDHEIRTPGTRTRRRYISVSAHVLRDEAGACAGFEGVLRDVSEYKRTQAALLQAGRELENRVRERTRELAEVNVALELEVAERRTAEQALRESETELRDLSRRLIKAQEEERRRLARELHDDLNQRLALFAMKLQRLGDESKGGTEALAASVRDLWDQTNELCLDVQRIAYQLHPSKLEELGLVVAVRSFCKELSEQTGLRVRFVECDVPEHIPPETALTIYRVIQESLWNVAKHSGADEALVELIGEDHLLRLSVADSGRGFDAEATRAQGLGLLSMRERMQLIGGRIEIESGASSGTRITASAPCHGVRPTAVSTTIASKGRKRG
jgi:PAS domain S-box-containing protein